MVTFIPVWVAQDVIILIAAIFTMIYIIRTEEHPEIILLEMICFCLLYAAVYENFATLVGYYGYGRSLIMIFNVPITVPIVEYLVVYVSLRLLGHMKISTWCKPFIVGFMGMLFDFSLDPLATKQIFATEEGIIGRWTWYILPTDVNIFGEPVYNFSGWVLLCGYAALFLLLGRLWYERTKKPQVGYCYPVLAMLAALVMLVFPPLSRFLLWLEPFLQKGSVGEWIMLIVYFILPTVILIGNWKGKMKSSFSFRSEYPLFIVLIGLHFSDIAFTLIGGYYEILWIVLLFSAIQWFFVLFVYSQGRRQT